MKKVNDGKWNILTISFFNRKLIIDFRITVDYTNTISKYCRLIFDYYNYNKPKVIYRNSRIFYREF